MSTPPTTPLPTTVSTPSTAPAAGGAVVPKVVTGWRRVAAGLAGRLVRLWCATLRVECPEPTRRMFGESSAALFVLWHNRLFVAAELSRRLRPRRPLHGLVSASKDGAWLSAFFESVGLRVVRGSSTRGGREAVMALVDVLRAGQDAGLTPDGPRGPIYVCKPGVVTVARRARPRVLLLGIHYSDAWRLRSWDRFQLPRPFSRVELRAREWRPAELEGEDARERVEEALRALNAEAPPAGTGGVVI